MSRRAYIGQAHGQVHYRQAGNAEGPALLLLHQAPSHSAMYDKLMRELEDDFYLLAPDLPGFGASDPLPRRSDDYGVSIADLAEVVHVFLEGVAVERCFVFGHHTGAAVAAALEQQYPGTAMRMAMSGPTLLTEEQRATLPATAQLPGADAQGEYLLELWRKLRSKDEEAPLAISQRELMSALAAGPAYRDAYQAVCEFDTAGALAAIACPTLVFAGDADPLYGAVEPALAILPEGSRAELEGGERTYVCERQADRVAALLREFFKKSEA
ncbi:MAG: alpha/beta fold hydrolase [Pseudomonadota bacterium]